MDNSTNVFQFLINYLKWYHIAHNPELKEQYQTIPGIDDIGSSFDRFINKFDVWNKGNQVYLFVTKLGSWLWMFLLLIIQWTWFLMNHEYIFEIIFVLLILYLITKVSKNILPPITFLYTKLNRTYRREYRRRRF